jgi:hypothetical protein
MTFMYNRGLSQKVHEWPPLSLPYPKTFFFFFIQTFTAKTSTSP